MATATIATAAALGGCASTSELASTERPDCPGKVVCPLTGELVCADQCPVRAGEHADVSLAVAQPKSCCSGSK